MTADTILHKYLRHLRYIDQGSIIHLDAVNLAFRLALEELEESMAPDATITELGTANLRIMELQADLERLQTATNTEVADLRQQLAQLDADNTALIRRNKELADELKRARLGAAAMPPSVLPTITSATILNTDHPNGTNITVTPAPAASASMWDDPASLTTLPADILDYWDGIAAGRWTWRRLPKPVRLAMVRHALSFGPEDGAMTMAEFDAVRPEWMPAAQSLPTTFGCSWSDLNDLRKEIEVHS